MFERNNSGDNDLIDKVNDLYKSKLIEENFVQVEFVPQYLVYLELIEVPRYTISSMVGTLGGGLNLWTGVTVLVFIEICETFMRIVKRACGGNKTDENKNGD